MPPPPPTRRSRLPGRARASAFVRDRAAAEGSDLSRLKFALAARGLSPRKRFGQNFLVRADLAERIVEHSHLLADDVAVEIGPGTGALTLHLVGRVRQVVAVEKDDGLVELLREELAEAPGLEVMHADFLEVDLAALAAARGVEKLAVVGNIPYNITTPILERLFEQREVVRSAVLLVQKEYAARLGAPAGTPEYGALTLFARYHAVLEPLMTLKASAFWPRPEVDSMLVRFLMRERPPVEVPDEALLFRIIRGSFQMRRKQLWNTLEAALELPKDKIERLCRHAHVNPQRRGETLTLEEFAKLARAAADYLGD
jgi:16S rRNA (adenine1518-N6/adenine1519-N6)-dimethyltransferase